MKKKKILVLTDDMPWGHLSIAKAIYSYLKSAEPKENFEVEFARVKMPLSMINDVYVLMYRYMPMTNKFSHKLMENDTLRDMFLETTDRDITALKKVINKINPDLIISSYFFHSHSLVRWRKKENKKFKLWTVAADPRSVNPISFVKGADLHLVYDEVVRKVGNRYGIDDENILVTGWWTRGEMYGDKLKVESLKVESRTKLGIEDDRPVVFVGGGSLGTNSLIRFLPVLMLLKKKCLIIFNTGTDKLAFSMVNEYAKLFEKLSRDDTVKIKCLGWIENMAEVLASVDIVFGKAGPNFLFDVVASQKPFVAITHIGGQEDGNIDLIKEKKLGWIKERVGSAEKFLMQYLDNPKKYNNKYSNEIAAEAELNRKSLGIMLKRIKEDFIPPKALHR